MKEIHQKILKGMCSPKLEDGSGYSSSELGYIGFGYTKNILNDFEHSNI